jgi:hypothetical protein
MDLAVTLRCLAGHGFDYAATATALSVPASTLLYRISRIEKLTGLSLTEPRSRTLLILAVTWETISGDEPTASAGSRVVSDILQPAGPQGRGTHDRRPAGRS